MLILATLETFINWYRDSEMEDESIRLETCLVFLILASSYSIDLCGSDGTYIAINGNLVTGPPPFSIYERAMPSTLYFPANPPKSEEFEDISPSVGNQSGSASNLTGLSRKSANRNLTVKAKWLNLSTNEIVLVNTNKMTPQNVSGWEIMSISLDGNSKKSVSLKNGTSILPGSSLKIDVPSVAGPGSIILKDESGLTVWVGRG
jgi:hypothetical protein